MKNIYYTWQDVETASNAIVAGLAMDKWCPDYIVGINPGGLSLSLLLSSKLGVPLETLNVQLHIGNTESNCWMSEDAFGYVNEEEREIYKSRWDVHRRKNILIVDNINKNGDTFNWVKQDWQNNCFPNEQYAWDSVWGKNVRFATMSEDYNSDFSGVNYYWDTVDGTSVVYPWEKDACLRSSMA